MNNYRIINRYPCYLGFMPIHGYVVQRAERGLFSEKWVDVGVFASKYEAEKLLKKLENDNQK